MIRVCEQKISIVNGLEKPLQEDDIWTELDLRGGQKFLGFLE